MSNVLIAKARLKMIANLSFPVLVILSHDMFCKNWHRSEMNSSQSIMASQIVYNHEGTQIVCTVSTYQAL